MSQPRPVSPRIPPADLRERAREIAVENGFVSDFPPEVQTEVAHLEHRNGDAVHTADVRDLRTLLWSSIDNRESRDLDQVEYCERLADDSIRLRLGVADVAYLVAKGSAIDMRAAANTTSLYTGVATFPMLPEELSTDLTSLLEAADRLVVVVDLVVDVDGKARDVNAYRALVANRAKLTYEPIGQWLAGGPAPEELAAIAGLEEQVRLQDEVAQRLRARRHECGALDLETIEARPVTSSGGEVIDLEVTRKNRARDLIEDFMIAANVGVAGFLEARRIPSIRRIVRVPKRWARLVELAKRYDDTLPDAPSSLALSEFLRRRRAADPNSFADISLSVVKLLGSGEYTVERPWEPDGEEGHFGLAVDDYSHTTAPNRRFADLVMQRLVKALLAGTEIPYTADELEAIAERCTAMESAARKVERTMRKVVAATLLQRRVGEMFDAIITGVNQNGTYARLTHPPAEGRVMRGERGLDVGDRVRVRLIDVDVEKGYIDFAKA